jgi:hypothetical protein
MKICVCVPTANIYSETFIREHIRRLPAEAVLYDLPPYTMRDEQPLVPFPIRSLIARSERGYMRRIGAQATRMADRRIASVLNRLGVDVVLAEYGPTAVAFLPACRAAAVMGVATMAFRRMVMGWVQLPPVVALLVFVPFGAAIYFAMMYWRNKPMLVEFFGLARGALGVFARTRG